ncbi:GSCOCT00013869001.3-RA-CDS [Cotesia congregata]|uniref:Gustatory receptor n=1 Tax=Cotesia congregata TaxID=51543 RepID=A0A8J2H7D1_COTCN|nr:GSCOCT00013869001.3-RA-CDS [Cotesia congregata]CAG5080971.1 gustatory receptor 8.3 [Cotesia congregata]
MQCINLNKIYGYFLIFQYIVYKIVGLSPWTLELSKIKQNLFLSKQNWRINQTQNNICKISYVGSGYNVFLVLVYALYHFYYQFFSEESGGSIFNNQTYKMIMNVASFITTVSFSWIFIFFVSTQKSMINIIDRLISVNKKLNISADSYSKDFLSYFIVITNFLVSLVKILLVLPNSSISSVLSENSSNVVCSWIIVQFTLLLGIVGKQIEAVNLSIKKMDDVRSDLAQIPALRVNRLLEDESACRQIKNIKRIYIELWEISGEINNLYGLTVLISLLLFSFEIIVSLHMIFTLPLLKALSFIFLHIATGMIAPWGIFLFLVLTSAVSKTTDLSKKTGQIISLLSNRRPINPKVKEQLYKFSNDLSHFKVEFSAYGALPLDRDLLGIVSSDFSHNENYFLN